jgi:hypothetical protein
MPVVASLDENVQTDRLVGGGFAFFLRLDLTIAASNRLLTIHP